MAAKFFTGLPLEGPDPECVLGHGERRSPRAATRPIPKPSVDMSKGRVAARGPCDESPSRSSRE